MKKEMLINVLQPEECRIAIIEDGILEELYVERTSLESYTGNIYKGRIVNLEPAIQAAFVDFSVGRNGFLHVSDVEQRYFERGALTGSGGVKEPRDREPDPRRGRERDRGKPRDPRRRAAPNDLPESGSIGPDPTSFDDRPPERDRRRERPDLSIKGRRDRSEEGPRRFGEGLVEPPPEPVHRAPRPVYTPPPAEEPAPIEPPIAMVESQPQIEPEPPVRRGGPVWRDEPPEFQIREREPRFQEPEPRVERSFFDEPVDPDLPPSRTHRGRTDEPGERSRHDEPSRGGGSPREPGKSEPSAPEFGSFYPREPKRGRGRGRGEEPQGQEPQRPRPAPPREPEYRAPEPTPMEPLAPIEPEPFDESPYSLDPPRRRGGRAAIRSRGEPDSSRPAPERPAAAERRPAPERPARPAPTPMAIEPERSRPAAERRPREIERAPREIERAPREIERAPREIERPRPSAGAEPPRDRERAPHARAGEPGYIPRRERLRSGDAKFGGDVAPPTELDWSRDELELDLEPRRPGPDDEDSTFGGEESTDPGKLDPRRRRRRRGRRRDQDLPPRASDQAPAPVEAGPNTRPARSQTPRARAPIEPVLDDPIDEFVIHDIDADVIDIDHDPYDDHEPRPTAVTEADEEIDAELELEIRKEIEEIEELEREMGLRGGPESKGARGDEPGRGRSPRGRGLTKPPIQEIFRRGDEVLVQVIKESIGTKGPTLSTYISIPGRYLVLMPGLNRVGVSRKIVDEGQRRKLREIMLELNPPKGLGFIVRTAGLERSKRELARDLAYLLRLWKVILRRIKKAKAPAPIYQESDMIIRTIRDIFNSEIDTIWIDEKAAFERAQEFLRVVMPRFANRIRLYEEKVPLFHKYGIEDEIAKIQRRHVPLPEGGSIVIDQTEALVAIDVNSGNFRVEDDAERTAYEMNLRAAREIARQLRLRDLGGVIVNDFIDMREERHRRGVERALREAIKRDRARTKILHMSAFGLIEMTRQRIRPSLKRSIYEDCPNCGGAGVAKTPESMAIDVMRLLALATHREEIRRLVVTVSPAVASYLSNKKRIDLARLESEARISIQIVFKEDATAEYLQITCYDQNGAEVRAFPAHPAPTPKRGR